jgi:hypothetical protein
VCRNAVGEDVSCTHSPYSSPGIRFCGADMHCSGLQDDTSCVESVA